MPIRVGQQFNTVEEISSDQAQVLYEGFKQIVTSSLENYERALGKLRDAASINKFLNYLVFRIRGVLYIDPLPGVMPSIAGSCPSYLLARYKGTKMDFFDFLNQYEPSEGDRKIRNLVLNLLKFPADTRPGANTSSLLIHMLTTSGLASCFYLANQEQYHSRGREQDLALLRLVCLFHDLGKLLDWEHHEERSRSELLELFREHVEQDSEAGEIVRIAAMLIVRKYRLEREAAALDKLRWIYEQADREASSIDRLSRRFLQVLPSDERAWLLKKVASYRGSSEATPEDFRNCYNEHSFWKTFTLDDIKRISQVFCREAAKLVTQNPFFSTGSDSEGSKLTGVHIARFDIRAIQQAIRVNDLRSMAGGSLIVDRTIFVDLPVELIELGLPAEALLYYGGGNLTCFLPHNQLEQVARIKHVNGLEIACAKVAWMPDFVALNDALERSLISTKLEVRDLKLMDVLQMNAFELCYICGSRPALRDNSVEGRQVCEVCFKRRKAGEGFHFQHKLNRLAESLPAPGFRSALQQYLKRMLEFISGSQTEEVERDQFEQYPNMAVLRIDANLLGCFMASALSITDAFERSIRVDYSLKGAYGKFLDFLRSCNRDEYSRVVLGTIYLGGDDGFAIVPSRVAVHLACYLLNEFYMEMGGKLTLSCGIAAAKPKHPLVQLYQAAGYLLDQVAKKAARSMAYKIYEEGSSASPGSFRGVLAFYVADGTNISETTLEVSLSHLEKLGLSQQLSSGYHLSEGGRNSILALLNVIRPATAGNLSLEGLSEAIKEDLKVLLSDKKERESCIKEVLRVVRSHIAVELAGDRSPSIIFLFGSRKVKTAEDEAERKIISGAIGLAHLHNGKIILPLADLVHLAKVMLGE